MFILAWVDSNVWVVWWYKWGGISVLDSKWDESCGVCGGYMTVGWVDLFRIVPDEIKPHLKPLIRIGLVLHKYVL